MTCMKRISNYFIIISILSIAICQNNYNLSLISKFEIQNASNNYGVSDVWGYTDETGIEYAIIGYQYGTYIFDVSSNPSEPELIADIVGPSGSDYYFHRDYKTYNDFLYIVNEMTGDDTGMQIIDLSPLPISSPIKLETYSQISQSHNLWIDSNGYAFIENYYPNNIHIVDVTDPWSPTSIGDFYGNDGKNCHDIYTRDNFAYVSEGWDNQFGIYDISNISTPIRLATIPVIGYAHNAWLDETGDYLLTTEETQDQTIKVWDISDLNNINLISEYIGQNGLAHNVHVKDNYMIISHYTSGLKIVDIFDPLYPVEVASYDTFPDNDDGGYYGCWGAFPFTNNGYIYGSDMQNGLYVLDFNQSQAGWSAGKLLNSDHEPLDLALMRSLTTGLSSLSDPLGQYMVGSPEGVHDFEISKLGEVIDTVSINFSPHSTINQDIYVESIAYIIGDINIDTIINIQDIILLVNLILSSDTHSDLIYYIADINFDDVINIQDLIMLVNIIIE